ncbi:MAG: histidine phosphatase family protein, partial [Dehalococcoidia bacterium]
MKLLLVRHGETDWNRQGKFQGHSDAGLTTLGTRQAQAVAQALGHYHPSALYSSPLLRAMQTAELIGRALGLEVTVLEGLKEADLGELEGLDSQTMRARYGQFYARWRQDPATATMPGGESLAQVQERAWGAVQQM